MNIERTTLHKQSALISTLVDDLIKIARKHCTHSLSASERHEDIGYVYGLNALLIVFLKKTVATFEILLGLIGNETTSPYSVSDNSAPDNLIALAPQLHSDPSVVSPQ
jgi:hypothetical protein